MYSNYLFTHLQQNIVDTASEQRVKVASFDT